MSRPINLYPRRTAAERLWESAFTEERRVARMSPEERFRYVEDLIRKLHNNTHFKDTIPVECQASFDDWVGKSATFKADVHKRVVDYYAKLDFVERYGLGEYSWIGDKDIQVLLKVLQVRDRAIAAAKLEKLESEIDGISAMMAKIESHGRYHREDVITLNASFDRIRVSLRVENDRGRKRQQAIDKVVAVIALGVLVGVIASIIACMTGG